jgi:hypothetical protein
MQRPSFIRLCWLYSLLLLCVAFLARCFLLLSLPSSRGTDMVEYFYDDGYYYLTVAANIAEYGRSTFDGLTATNGYQPLWLLVLTCLARLVGTNAHTLFVSACILVYALILGSILLAGAWRKNDWAKISLCSSVGLAAIVLRWPLAFVQGLEPVLLVPLLLLFITLVERISEPRELYLLSAILAAMFLVRLDSLSLYVSALMGLAWPVVYRRPVWNGGRVPTVLGAAARLSVFVLPTVAVYMLVNQWLFNSAVPVSGLAKSIGGPKFSNWGVASAFIGPLRESAFLIPLLILLEWSARKWARPAPLFYRSFFMFGAAGVIQCLYFCTEYTWDVMPWYECFLMTCAALVVARIVYLCSQLVDQPGPPKSSWLAFAAIGIVGLWMSIWAAKFTDAAMPLSVRTAIRNTLHVGNPKVADARTFNQISLSMLEDFFDTSRHVLIAMGDRAGGIGYWGRHAVSVVQLEGLMLDKRYIQARQEHRGEEYLEQGFPIDTFVIDREVVIAVNGADGQPEYVIPDPVRGRIVNEPVPTFCFPSSAVLYTRKYFTFTGVNTRMAFRFADRVRCTPAVLDMIRSIELGIGLQQYSLPGEYDYRGGFASSALEKRDRHWSPGSDPKSGQ